MYIISMHSSCFSAADNTFFVSFNGSNMMIEYQNDVFISFSTDSDDYFISLDLVNKTILGESKDILFRNEAGDVKTFSFSYLLANSDLSAVFNYAISNILSPVYATFSAEDFKQDVTSIPFEDLEELFETILRFNQANLIDYALDHRRFDLL